MLNYKKRTQTDNENLLKDQRKDNQQLKMSDISKIEHDEDRNDHDLTQKSRDGTRAVSDHMLIMGLDQKNIDSQLIDPLSGFQNQGFASVPRSRTNANVPYATINPQGFHNFNSMMNHKLQPNSHHQSNPSNPNYVINIQQTVDKDSIIVETNYNQKKFLFYDRNRNFLGGFSVHDFIRFITSNVTSNFLRGVDSDSAKPIIEKYICKVSVVERPTKRYTINMLNYFESPFMGNIETLIKFYTFIHEFEDNNLQKELDTLNANESLKTKDIFNSMMYTLLNHILKIIAALTNKLTANDPNTSKNRDSLLNYSVAIVYRLSKFVRNEIDIKVDELTVLNQDLLRIEGIRTSLSSKLDAVQRSIDKQNAEIDVVLRNVLMFQMASTKSSLPPKKSNKIIELATTKTKHEVVDCEYDDQDVEDNEDNENLLDALAESLGQNIDTPSVPKNEQKPVSVEASSTEKISSTPDKSNIFNENSESRRKTLSSSKSRSSQHSENIRISELLDEVGKLKAISDKRISEPHKKGSDKSEILFMAKHRKSSEVKKSKSMNASRSPHLQELSSGSAKSLSDILMLHGNVDYGADESENSFDVDEEHITESQLKQLSTPSNPKLSVIDIE